MSLRSGVAAGSIAATTQAGIGNVVAGSAFAALQSTGVVGLSAASSVAAGSIAGAATATVVAASDESHKHNKKLRTEA